MPRALAKYRRKRNFGRTPEPAGRVKRKRKRKGLIFVVQRHAARHLHFDFRLEWQGVLKSWAVPKGPSLNPQVKRLAVEVEDHPLEYAQFSGTIPKGQYGAGAVTIWDRGVWQPEGDAARAWSKGRLDFSLVGSRLRGRWLLVRTRGGRERQPSWLLIKCQDTFATAQNADLTEILPQTIAEAARRPKASFRPTLQLATLVSSLPSEQHWFAELKLDGYRLLIHAQGARVTCSSRNGRDWTKRLPGIVAAIRQLNLDDTWLDGELVATDANGQPQFELLQRSFDEGKADSVQWIAFDALQVAGVDVRERPLRERKRLLQQTLASLHDNDPVRVIDYVEGAVGRLWQQVCRERREGLILKDPAAPYRGGRTRAWLKLKCRYEEEFVVGGFTQTGSGRPTLTSLLLGHYDKRRRLRFVGRAGSGFSNDQLAQLRRRLDRTRRTGSSFDPPAQLRSAEKPIWVKPTLVVQVRFAEWTAAGLLRQPLFLGVREDKPARDVRAPEAEASLLRTPRADAKSNPSARTAIKLTHPQRVLFPDDGITKAQLAVYYETMQDALWPHLIARPVSVLRAANEGKTFFQRHGSPDAPKLFTPVAQSNREPYLRVRAATSLPLLAQLGIVELHTWGAHTPRVDRADRLTFDLDPDPALAWATVRTAALLVREMLDELGLKNLLKTSGGAGLHIVVPLTTTTPFTTASAFSGNIARHLARLFPDRFTAQRGAPRRRGKIFIDWQRNQQGATTVAAYSPRWRPGVPVSMPVEWSEVGRADLRFAHFNLRNAPTRFLEQGDAWMTAGRIRQALRTHLVTRVETLSA
jgi:bifunctional non-homologous end joining protein LigD